MRLVTPDGMARVCVLRCGGAGVVARRVGNEITLQVGDGSAGLSWATQALLGQLPRSEAAQISPVGAPTETVSRNLIGTHDAAQLADRVRALGAEPRAAMVLGSALSSRMAFAEIVYYALCSDQDRISRRPAAVGVFYTKRGRIVGGAECLAEWTAVDDVEAGLGSRDRPSDQSTCRVIDGPMGGVIGLARFFPTNQTVVPGFRTLKKER